MRYLLLILILNLNPLCGQEENYDKSLQYYQLEWLKKAEEDIKNADLQKAYIAYGFAALLDTMSVEGKKAHHKSDSLKVLLRDELKKEISGTWKLVSYGSNWGYTDFLKNSQIDSILVISPNSLTTYIQSANSNQRKVVKKEELVFNNIPGTFPSYWELLYSNNQIWNYRIGKNGKILHLTHTGDVKKDNSRTEIVCGNYELVYQRVE